MALNQYFENYDQTAEQDLIEDINAEAIAIYGFNMFYLPRRMDKVDQLFGEDTSSYFDKAYPIEVYIDSIFQYRNNEDVIMKEVGLLLRDSATFSVARKTFLERLHTEGFPRPREGDLIYFPTKAHKNLFEITYVEDEQPFYQLGGLYIWQMKVSLFDYSDEKLRTGIPEIDRIEDRYVVSIDLTMGAGSGTFQAGEVVYQGANLGAATFQAEVISWATPKLRLKHTKGALQNAVNLIGVTSAASRLVTSSSLDEGEASTNDPYEDNENIQEEGEDLIEFDPSNPFGGE